MKNHEHYNLPTTTSQTRSIKGVFQMSKNIAKFAAVVAFSGLLFLTACAENPYYHENFMRGQVVGVDDNEVVLCIGNKDGAQVGQTLDAYRVKYVNSVQEGDSGYKRDYIGEVAINTIVNDHFARASVNSGDVRLHDIVELKK